MQKNDLIIIGLDGGASKINGLRVIRQEDSCQFLADGEAVEMMYRDIPGFLPDFTPVDINLQLQDFREGQITMSPDEIQMQAVFVEACAWVIRRLIPRHFSGKVLLGIGLPGLKTLDKRGVAVMANGPRMIHFCDSLEARLPLDAIPLQAPIAKLGSDADYCGIGENFAAAGKLCDLQNGYYLGSGSGVADALKLQDALIPFDQIKSWMAKTWEMQWHDGQPLERYVSARGITQYYLSLFPEDDGRGDAPIHLTRIAELADQGQPEAKKTLDVLSDALAALVFERIETIYGGWNQPFQFVNPERSSLQKEHSYRGLLLDGIVLGQRLGQVLASKIGEREIGVILRRKLNGLITGSLTLPDEAKEHYQNFDKLIRYSTLRNAPALGAGIDAWLWQES